MKTVFLFISLFILSLSNLSAARIGKITPFTTDKKVRLELTLSTEENETIPLSVNILHQGKNEILCNVSRNLYFKQKSDTTVVWDIDCPSPELWSPVNPVLYSIEVKVGNDIFHERIGFRRFEMRDGLFYLNGKPIYLRGNAINPPDRGIPKTLEHSKEFARDYIRFMKSLNINIIRIPYDKNWLEVCDEEGMMIFAGRYGRPKHATRNAPPMDFNLSLQTYKDIDLGPFAPHPSVVIYVLSNEMPFDGEIGDKYRVFLTKMCNELKKWDDTRLYIGNTGYGLGKSGDIYDVHRYWGWYYNTFLTYLNMRDKNMWQNADKVQPITFTECVGNYTGIDGRFNLCSRTKQPGAQKCWTGHLPNDLQAEAALEYQAFVLKNATELFRRLRIHNSCLAGTMPFTIMFHNWDGISSFVDMKPKPVAKQYQISYQPILLSWENWHSQVYAGDKLPVVAHVVNDDDYCNDLVGASLHWWIEKDGNEVLSGERILPTVLYYQTSRQPLTISIPAYLSTGYYTLKGEIRIGDRKVSYNENELFIAGREWADSEGAEDIIYVYDTSDEKRTMNKIKRLGYRTGLIYNINELSNNSTLVLGSDSWDDNLNSQVGQLRKYIENGGRVICLEQNWENFNQLWLPVKVKYLKYSNNSPVYLSPSLAYKDGMNINLERSYHPVFKGLTYKHFRLWSDYTSFDESKDGFPAIYPVNRGYDLGGNDMENVSILANYSRALSATALSEIFIGKGSVLLSGFDLVNHCGNDPVADRLFANMICYMSDDGEHDKYVMVKDSIVWGDYASERGMVNAPCNGLMVNTVPVIPAERVNDPRYKLKIDEYGYQYAGSYGGWNSKPGVQYISYGRRPMAPFSFSKGGSPVVDKSSVNGEGFFYMSYPKDKNIMVTVFENPTDEYVTVGISVMDGVFNEYKIRPGKQLTVKTNISRFNGNLKVAIKGDRRVVLLKTLLCSE